MSVDIERERRSGKNASRAETGIPVWARALAALAVLACLGALVVKGTGLLNRSGEEPAGEVADEPLSTDKRVIVAINKGDLAEAESACRQLLSRDPFDAFAMFNLAYSLHRQGKLDEAAEHYQSAADFHEYGRYSRYNLACIYAVLERPDDAMALLTEVIEDGFVASRGIANERDFDSLRSDPEFHRLVMVEEATRDRTPGGR